MLEIGEDDEVEEITTMGFNEPEIREDMADSENDIENEISEEEIDEEEWQVVDEDDTCPEINMQELEECDWEKHYVKCPEWKETWEATKDNTYMDWPHGVKCAQGRMYLDEKLCIPMTLQRAWIRENHEVSGHASGKRLWEHMLLQVNWADERLAKRHTNLVTKQCETCQACQRPVRKTGVVEFTPIPPKTMVSVAIDLFRMPHVTWEGNAYDTAAVCVDRHSGWIVAIPCLNKGLTGAKVAKSMLQHQWRPFGIPSVITSDQGSHFIGAWWQNMCAYLGIRHATSIAYHHQANGRAEVAGQTLREVLRKIINEGKMNWVEALPMTLDKIHDMKNDTGLSPYQILFGRERPLANVPYQPSRECEDAKQFFDRMKEIDEKVSRELNERHTKLAARINASRKETETYQVGMKVWYRRPENSGEKLDSRWIGPGIIKGREGQNTYLVEIKEGKIMKAHYTFLKKYVEDEFNGKKIELYHHKRTVEDEEEGEPDEWIVDEIVDHKMDKKKGPLFKTKWKGFEEETTWEPIGSFFHRYAYDIIKYCRSKGIPLDVMPHLSPEPKA